MVEVGRGRVDHQFLVGRGARFQSSSGASEALLMTEGFEAKMSKNTGHVTVFEAFF